MVTIKDIAKETNFSFKTVSRVINKEKGVSPLTKSIIEEAVIRLGYVMNPMAGSLKSGKTGMVGILSGSLNPSVKTAKLYAIQQGLERAGMQSLLSCLDLADREACENLSSFLRLVDGVIILNPPQKNHFEEIIKKNTKPILYVDGSSTIFPSIMINREWGVLDAFNQLQTKYNHFIYFNGMSAIQNDSRLVGYKKFTTSLNEPKTWQIIPIEGNNFRSGYSEGHKQMVALRKSEGTLILCTNDQMAFGLLKALYEHDISVPEHVGVLGFDGDEYGTYGFHSLATIKQPVEELGNLAVKVMGGFTCQERDKYELLHFNTVYSR
jgi:DNA-binding LacI/PurR family transcriptional regulator